MDYTTRIVLIPILSIIAVLLVIYFTYRLVNLLSKRLKREPLQLPEIIDNNYFLTSDQKQLKMQGSVNPKGKHIILGVHGIYGNSTNFNALYENEELSAHGISFISFNQRNIKKNEDYKIKAIGVLVNDVIDVLSAISNKYENQTITLLLEGYNCSLVKLINKYFKVKRIILVNPVTNKKAMRFTLSISFLIFMSFFYHLHRRIAMDIDYKAFTTNETYIEQIKEEHPRYYMNQILQTKMLNKKLEHHIHALKTNILIIQSDKSKFLNEKRLDKLKSEKVTIKKIDSLEQYIFTKKLDNEVKKYLIDYIVDNKVN